jgi:KUP system potassium uptake protein
VWNLISGPAPSGWLNLSFVLLALTGVEALYDDLGHFAANPIRVSSFAVVLPGVMLNYLGQGAFLLLHPTLSDAPFFRMVEALCIGPSSWSRYWQ